jgi:hypothetical protein
MICRRSAKGRVNGIAKHAKEAKVVGQPEAIQAAITLEERASRIIQAALKDAKLMSDVQDSQRLEKTGDKGEAWSDVKVRLKLV